MLIKLGHGVLCTFRSISSVTIITTCVRDQPRDSRTPTVTDPILRDYPKDFRQRTPIAKKGVWWVFGSVFTVVSDPITDDGVSVSSPFTHRVSPMRCRSVPDLAVKDLLSSMDGHETVDPLLAG